MNASQHSMLVHKALTAAALIDAQPVPMDNRMMHPDPHQCVACGTPLDAEAMEYCYDSDTGFHVRPSLSDFPESIANL